MEDMACLEGRRYGHVEHFEAGHGQVEHDEAVEHSSWLAGPVGGVAGEEGNEVADNAGLQTLVVEIAGRTHGREQLHLLAGCRELVPE